MEVTGNYLRGGLPESEAPRPQGGASRQGIITHIMPLHPACTAGLAGHVPAERHS
jgi:hypothetical protein